MLSLTYNEQASEQLPTAPSESESPIRKVITTLATMGAAAAALKLLLHWYVDGWDNQPIDIDGGEPERHLGEN